ncbi:hypothetical protein ASZ90_009681 [hydrocarbon metagenome]|uniref:Uncharacterized protein n=1 Tax=hydrocarbon metagenome TaxID=938273 RepID=A0A0W8FI57_9ZZZZ
MLEMGEPRHDGIRMPGGGVKQGLADRKKRPHAPEQFVPEPDPDAGGDLVVARPPDVEPPADLFADPVDQVCLLPCVDILKAIIVCALRQAVLVEIEQHGHQRPCGPVFDDPLPVQHQQVRHVDQDVRPGDPVIGLHRREETDHFRRSLVRKAALPDLILLHAINNPSLLDCFLE